jgi:hypothetical protein
MTIKSPHKGAEQGERGTSAIGPLFWVAVVVAVILIIAYVTLGVFLYQIADDGKDDATWNHLTYLAGALSTLVSTVMGWLFGHEVHRGAAQAASSERQHALTAHNEAMSAHSVALDAQKQAAAGQALAWAIKAVPDVASLTAGLTSEAADAVAVPMAHLTWLQTVANTLYPDAKAASRPSSPPPATGESLGEAVVPDNRSPT